jgi:hypothetical protein
MKPVPKFKWFKRKKPGTVLGLALDGGKLEGAVLRLANGAWQRLQSFSVALTLDPLTAAPELVGREIRNHLNAAGIRERNCIVGVPLKWVLTAHTELPPLPEADAASLLQMEAEQGFSSDVSTLQITHSRSALAGDKQYVLFAGIPLTQIGSLEQVLAAAKLKPVSFGLAITALQPPADKTADGVLALVIGESTVGLQLTAGGGVAALRALEGAIENEGSQRALQPNIVSREARITLGQLPQELRATVKRIRIFGPRELAQPLADEMELRFEPLGMKVEMVKAYAPDELGAPVPADTVISPAFSLAAGFLGRPEPVFEFLPPKPTVIEQLVTKYSSGRLQTTGAIGAAVTALVLGLFGYQEIELVSLRAQWAHMQAKVVELQNVEDNIRQYRPWYDQSYTSLAILRQLTLAFPEDGSVTAKTIEIHDGNTVSCSGTATSSEALLAMWTKLRDGGGISGLKLDQNRGKAPMQFTLDFQYGNGGTHGN